MANSNGTINVATLYERKLEERFSIGSKTNAYAGKKYDFVGTKSIEIITADRMEMVDYTRTGTSRYGTIYELGDTKQTLTMTKDRAFTFSIDAANAGQRPPEGSLGQRGHSRGGQVPPERLGDRSRPEHRQQRSVQRHSCRAVREQHPG